MNSGYASQATTMRYRHLSNGCLRFIGPKVLNWYDSLSNDALVMCADRKLLTDVASFSKVD
jgi:hypothetical protein